MPVSSDTASYRASAFRQVIEPVAWGIGATLVLSVLILVGSRNLAHFDAALVGYTFSVLFATFGLTYRYAMWLQRPPTAMYWRRGWQAFFRRGWRLRNAGTWVQRVGVDVLANRFIFARDRLRGLTHMLIMWGCLLAVAITFPLVFGWLHFRPVAGDLSLYEAVAFGFPAFRFPHDSVIGFLLFHGLVWSSFLVIAGVMLAMRRRMREEGVAAVQRFAEDFMPLILLFAVSLTGLDAHRELHVDEGLRLHVHRDSPCDHGDRHVSLAAVRKVLPHLSAAGATGRRVLQGRRAQPGTGRTAVAAATRSARACTSRI